MQVNLLVASYVASAAVSAAVAALAWRRRDTVGARALALLMLAVAWWLVANALEASSLGLSAKIAWSVVAYPGIEIAPVMYLLFVLAWTRQESWLTRPRLALLLVVPLASVGMAATNEWHHLLWPTVTLIDAWGVSAVYEHGPWFWVEVVYAWSLLGAGLVALLAAIYRYPAVSSARIRLVIVASLVPILGSVAYAAGLAASVHADLSSIEFAIAGVIGAWAVLRSRLLEIIPVAWSTLVDSLADAVLVLEPSGRIAAFNLSATRLLGTGPDAVGHAYDRALHRFPELVAVCAGAGDREAEIGVRAESGPSGSEPVDAAWYNVRVTAIGNGREGDAGRLVVLRDVTERRAFEDERRAAEEREVELEARLRMSAKMEAVGQLAGGVAHDFNNLLTAIRGFAELHLAAHSPDDPGRDDVLEIERAAERAAELTKGLLAFSRRADAHPAPIDLAEVASNAVALLRRLVGEHITVRLEAHPEVPYVLADRVQIDQVLLNLAANARDAMPAGGTLTVAVQPAMLTRAFAIAHPGARPGRHVLLEVADTGVGMDEATQAHLFEPFFTTKPPGAGTGLGLASVYGIVKQAAGYIDAESHPGAGSVFRVYLPVFDGETPEAQAKPAAGKARSGGSETILLVEDESAVRLFAQRVLEDGGYRVVAFGDPGAAFEALLGDPGAFDALVTDVVMPTMSGPTLAERVIELRPGLPILFMSGYRGSALRAGAPPVLAKPFGARELADAVGALFGRSV